MSERKPIPKEETKDEFLFLFKRPQRCVNRMVSKFNHKDSKVTSVKYSVLFHFSIVLMILLNETLTTE